MIGGLITAGIELATAIINHLSLKESRKYLDRLTKIKMEIIGEEGKGYESDDARLEDLYKELKVILDAVQLEVIAYAKVKQ